MLARLKFPRFILLTTTALLLVGFLPAGANDAVDITRLWMGYRETSSFVRLYELFTGREHTGRASIKRTQPDERNGFYYTIRLRNRDRAPLPDGTVVLQMIAPDAEEPRTYRFPYEAESKHELRLDVGITGRDWSYGKTLPLAWKIEVVDTSGQVLASRQSFLWTKPRNANS